MSSVTDHLAAARNTITVFDFPHWPLSFLGAWRVGRLSRARRTALRKQLARHDDRMLLDLGLLPEDIDRKGVSWT